MSAAVLAVALLGACASAEPQPTIPRSEHEAETQQLRAELSATQEQAETEIAALSAQIDELRGENRRLREQLSSSEAESARFRETISELEEQTGTSSTEAALDRLDSLITEIESLRELVRDRAFAESLIHGRRQQPQGELEPDPNPRIPSGFTRMQQLTSSYVGDAVPLRGDRDVLVTARKPGFGGARFYLPTGSSNMDTGLIPLVRYKPDDSASLIFLVRVRYPSQESPLYLESIEISAANRGRIMRINLDPVRRLSDGEQRLEEALVESPESVERLAELFEGASVRISYNGTNRSVTETAPQMLRGRLSTMLYVLRALGGDLTLDEGGR